LLEGLSTDHNLLEQQLFANNPTEKEAKQALNEGDFRWLLNEDAMACDKLAEGIRQFAKDKQQLALLLSALKK
jgi:transaldolase